MKSSTYIKIGIIVVLTLIVTFWGINFLKGKDIFHKEQHFTIIYDKIDGLTKSSSVVLRGFKIGQVQDIRFTSTKHESLTVEITIEKDIHVTEGTIAHIFSSDLMGTKSIELILGESEIRLMSGDTLSAKIEESLSDQVKLQMLPLKRKTESLMTSIETAIEAVKTVFNQQTSKDLHQSLEKIQSAIISIQRSATSLDTILTDGQDKIGGILFNMEQIATNLNENGENISKIIENVSTISDSIASANLCQTLINAENSFAQLDTLLLTINNGSGSANQFINDTTLYSNLKNTTANLNKLFIDINENPDRYINLSLIKFSKNNKKDKGTSKK